jgi:hypothetical protein
MSLIRLLELALALFLVILMYDCPFCRCVFVTSSDFECHLVVFGSESENHHLALLRSVHNISSYLRPDYLKRSR